MPRRTERRLELTTSEKRALEAAKRTAGLRHRRRIEIILALNSAGSPRTLTVAEVVQQKPCTRKHVYGTLNLYLEGGRTPEALKPRKAGRPAGRSGVIQAALLAIRAEHDEPLSLPEYRAALWDRLDRLLSTSSVRRYLALAGIRPRSSRDGDS